MDRFDEACQVLKLLRTQPKTTFEGRYYRLQAAPLMPKPLQRPQPELLAGAEARR
jgi:alkanesulfonate monooxygenase SsuD/methylene tetrahydromethanopterin reductase-like flavin-dependent oxidoreductase (luciferase family)